MWQSLHSRVFEGRHGSSGEKPQVLNGILLALAAIDTDPPTTALEALAELRTALANSTALDAVEEYLAPIITRRNR